MNHIVITMPGTRKGKTFIGRKSVGNRYTIMAQVLNEDDAVALCAELNTMKDRHPDKPISEHLILADRKPGQSWAQQSNQRPPRMAAGKR